MGEAFTLKLRKYFQQLWAICLVLFIMACENDKGKEIVTEPVISTYYLIRHAEKDRTNPDNPDPELTQDGLDRAIRWAEIFDPIELDAIYSTNYERTSMTAAPTSVKKDIDVVYYEPDMDVQAFMLENQGSDVLIVGHSNTTPAMVNKLLGEEKYNAMDDTDNGSLFIVRVIDGKATDIRLNTF